MQKRSCTYRFTVVYAAFLLLGCKERNATSEPEAQQFARRILGPAESYHHVPAKEAELNASMVARRAHAWRVAEEALRPVTVDLTAGGGGGQRTVANWQTWYDRTEFRRMFDILYRCYLSPDERQAFKDPARRQPIDQARIDKVLAELPHHDMGSAWTEKRFTELLGQLTTGNDLAGLNGVDGTGMSLYSPALVAHYLANAPFVWACDGKTAATGSGDAFGECFSKPFPEDAAAVKPTFNARATGVLAVDTGAAALTAILNADGARRDSWNQGQTAVVQFPDDDALATIHHVTYRQGSINNGTYLLTGIHILTKDIPEWAWVSLWWSPHPAEDFGSDRPKDFATKVDPVFAHYKMCTVSTFTEQDEAITNGAASALPADLLDSLRAVYNATKPATWCSNPFIEHMPHGARSNCIGCHQHGGPDGMPSATLAKGPDLLKTTSHFKGDFMASFHGGRDDFQGLIQEVVSNVDLEGDNVDQSVCIAAP